MHRRLSIVLVIFACCCLTACAKRGESAGDYEVYPVQMHQEITRKGYSSSESVRNFYPATGHNFYIAYPTAATETAVAGWYANKGEGSISSGTLAFCGNNTMVEYSGSDIEGRNGGRLYVAQANAGPVTFLRFSDQDRTVDAARIIQGRSLPFNTLINTLHVLMSSQHAKDPAIIGALRDLALGNTPLVKLDEQQNASGDTAISIIPVSPEESFRERCQCAMAVWILTDGDDGEPLAKLMMEQQQHPMGRYNNERPWDLKPLHPMGRNLNYGPVHAFFHPDHQTVTSELVEHEAQALENIFKHLPEDGSFPFPIWLREQFSDRNHGLPLQFSFGRMAAINGVVADEDADLFRRLLDSEVRYLSALVAQAHLRQLSTRYHSTRRALTQAIQFQAEGWTYRGTAAPDSLRVAQLEAQANDNHQSNLRKIDSMADALEDAADHLEGAKDTIGNRTLAHMLTRSLTSAPDNDKSFEQIILTSPDTESYLRLRAVLDRLRRWSEEHPLTEGDRAFLRIDP